MGVGPHVVPADTPRGRRARDRHLSPDEATAKVAAHWFERTAQSLASAEAELSAGRLHEPVNRCYYAAFYAASAVLLRRGHHFVKHAGVRNAVHLHLVKPATLPAELGGLYDDLFDARLEADYTAFATFRPEEVRRLLERSRGLVAALQALVT